MKVIRYIIGVLLLAIAYSCTEIELQPDPGVQSGLIQVIPRVIPFSDSATRADDEMLTGKETAETNLTCMALVIFDNDGKCIDFQFKEGSDLSFIIDRKVLSKTDDADPANDIAIDDASIYAFANIPGLKGKSDWEGKDLAHFENLPIEVKGVAIPSSGLPMSGAFYGKTGSDSQLLPKVDLDPDKVIASPLMTIDLYSAYAKVVVTVSVDAKEYETLGIISYFTPANWQVFNIPAEVDFNSGTNSDTNVLEAAPSSARFEGVQAIENDNISFLFYLPERYLTGGNTEYKYPFAESDGSVRDEDLGLRQKYKKEHLTSTQKATYVKLSGTFSDYQGHKKRVEYDLYVGGNEYDDFNIKRNVLYTNDVVVRGAKQSNGDNDDDGVIDDVDFMNTVSYDGRVNVDESAFIVRLERETVLDAHWEIRPMRISVLEGSVTVRIEDSGSTPWIRMENSAAVSSAQNKNLYLDVTDDKDIRYGKRRYFTTDLLTQLSDNTEYTFGPGEHCVWIYVDENVATTNTTIDEKSIPVGADAIRKAVISISHYDANGNLSKEPVNYTIAQRYLFPVRYTAADSSRDTIYNIEYHEEYLYNYDATNPYGQTEYEGMPWGLDGEQLSYQYDAFFTKEQSGILGRIIKFFIDLITSSGAAKYDFYLVRDNPYNGAKIREAGKGYIFTRDIINFLNSDNDNANDIKELPLDREPASAIEYCYNKNRRDNNGAVVSLNWYLPAIDEMEEIAWAGYGTFDVFHNLYYWSSMPSYKRSYIDVWGGNYGDFYVDDDDRARATKVNFVNGSPSEPVASGVAIGKYSGYLPVELSGTSMDDYVDLVEDASFYEPGNHPRSNSNRVRCVYKPTITN